MGLLADKGYYNWENSKSRQHTICPASCLPCWRLSCFVPCRPLHRPCIRPLPRRFAPRPHRFHHRCRPSRIPFICHFIPPYPSKTLFQNHSREPRPLLHSLHDGQIRRCNRQHEASQRGTHGHIFEGAKLVECSLEFIVYNSIWGQTAKLSI